MRSCLIFALTLYLSASNYLWAEVVATRTYDVAGDTLQEVFDFMRANGPVDSGGTHWPGAAEVGIREATSEGAPTIVQQGDQLCQNGVAFHATVETVVTRRIETTVILPNWPGAATKCDAVQAEWARFLAALRAHEVGHDAVALTAFRDANPLGMLRGEGVSCSQADAVQRARMDVDARVSAEYARLTAVVVAASDTYDSDTRHGETQGAVLNTQIRCPESPAEWAQEALDDLSAMNIPDGVKNSLIKKLQGALNDLEANKTTAAAGKLTAALNEVKAQAGKTIAQADADKLTSKISQALQ